MAGQNLGRSAGMGMALGALAAAIIALIVQLTTGDGTIWVWAIPLGVAVGFAIGAGAARRATDKPKDEST